MFKKVNIYAEENKALRNTNNVLKEDFKRLMNDNSELMLEAANAHQLRIEAQNENKELKEENEKLKSAHERTLKRNVILQDLLLHGGCQTIKFIQDPALDITIYTDTIQFLQKERIKLHNQIREMRLDFDNRMRNIKEEYELRLRGMK